MRDVRHNRYFAFFLTADPMPIDPPAASFKLIHVDRSLLVVNKPPRLLSVPGRGEDKQDCLIRRVQQEFPDALIVHRLDFDTSGLLVVARGPDMHRRLSILFQNRQVDKCYIALVDGRLAADSGEVDLPLGVDWPNRPRHQVDFAAGKPSLTRYRVIAYAPDGDFTRLALIPETGRTHQLRVHMQALGHAILGDPLYADEKVRGKADRLLLHAERLTFEHPVTRRRLDFHCPPNF